MSAQTTYRKFAQFYDAYVQDFADDLEFYAALCQPGDRILEIGCGTGRILKYFLERGHAVTGVDISRDMLAVAQEKLRAFAENGQLHLLNHDFRHAPLDTRFDKVLVTFYTFNYILEQPATFLRHVAAALVPGGLLAMDLFYPHTLAHPDDDDAWRETTRHFRQRVIRLKDKRAVRDNIEERLQIYREGDDDMEITTRRRYYAPDEIVSALRSAGFEHIRMAADYTGAFEERRSPDAMRHNFVITACAPNRGSMEKS